MSTLQIIWSLNENYGRVNGESRVCVERYERLQKLTQLREQRMKRKKREDDKDLWNFDPHSVFQRHSDDYNTELLRGMQFNGCVKRSLASMFFKQGSKEAE